MEKLSAIVLAGDRPDNRKARPSPPNVFTEIAGIPSLNRVIGTLSSCNYISKIFLVGPRIKEKNNSKMMNKLLDQKNVKYVEPQSGPSESAAKAFHAQAGPALLTTADHALLNNKIIGDFLQISSKTNADLIVGLVPFRRVKDSYPDSKRTQLRFKGVSFCGSNLFLLKTQSCSNALNFWAEMESIRKTPWKIVNQFGFLYLIKYKLGILTIREAFNILSKKTNCKITYVEIDEPRAAVDVDSWEDLSLAERIIKSDVKNYD